MMMMMIIFFLEDSSRRRISSRIFTLASMETQLLMNRLNYTVKSIQMRHPIGIGPNSRRIILYLHSE